MPDDGPLVAAVPEVEIDLEAAASAFDRRRLTQARHRAGVTKAALARAIGVSPTALTQFESGTARPSSRTLTALADALGISVAYLTADRPIVRVPAAHFRSLRSTRVAERLQALALIGHAGEIVRQVERHVVLPDVALPAAETARVAVDCIMHAEDAARQVRREWDIPPGPLPHLVRTLEMHGVIVVCADFPASERVDAFSCRLSDGRPMLCLSRDRGNVLRRRFTAAHELGHLVLGHDPARDGGRAEHERQADAFAAELLAPRADIAPSLPSRLDLARLLQLRDVWGLSASALMRRSREVGVLSENAYRQGMIRLSQLGWRKTEPPHQDLPGEWPVLLTEAIALASGRGLTLDSLVDRLRLPRRDVADIVGIVVDDRPRLTLISSPPVLAGL